EIYSNIRTYREKAIPIDAYILDFDWMEWGGDNYGEFRWGSKFPDGQSGTIVDTLKKYDMHLMGIRKPRVHVATTQGAYCNANAFFIDYVNDYFSGKQVGRLNFNKPAVRKWFWESFAVQNNTYAKGMSGYWNDEADEYGGNLMFMQMQRGQFEGQRSFNNNRVWSINRNFYTGAQRYAYSLWSGDINTGFPTMADQRLFMLSSMTVGVSWWGMDIGGFNGTPNSENYFRWIQFGAFVPVFRVHGTHNQEREPWNYGAEAEAIATEYIRLRYRFMPYIYSAARENHRTGLSIARPLVMEYPDDPKVSNLSTEWLFGSSLLVAPVVTAGAVQQTVYLPEGGWYDFHSGQYFAGSTSYTVPVTRKDIPLFVKAGSIIPMSPVSQSVDAPEAKNTVILSSFPGGDGSCVLYDDDGTTYDYEKGIYSTDTIIHQRDDHRVLITIGSRIGTYAVSPRDWLAEANWIDALPDSVVLDGKLLKNITLDSLHTFGTQGWSLDSLAKKCYAKFTDNGDAHTVVFYFSHGTSSILQENQAPHQFELEQNYPNPFNPTTTIGFTVVTTVSSEVFESAVKKENDGTRTTLKVYNVLGQEVSILFNGIAETGKYHQVTFDASNLSSGMYVARLQSGDNVQMRKMTLLK
ncbi:MAG: DUF5110 domain-containing protein, partial [Bacteroidetes bacterium]|nr:DUF5110 domain-containing protein [Bacteroidota bacterium]